MNSKKWFWGLFFILAGGLFLANALELFALQINFWSLLLTIGMLMIIVGSVSAFNFTGILVPLAVILNIYAEQLNFTVLGFWPLVITALLVGIGLDILFHRKNGIVEVGVNFDDEEIVDGPDEENVRYHVDFGSGIKYVNSDNFRKGDFRTKFGGMEIYFENAKLNKKGAEIILDVAFGGVELYIPKEWNVSLETSVFLGGIDEKRKHKIGTGPKVVIKGRVVFGGVEIKYI